MSALASFAGWSFIPNLASGFIHNALLNVLPLARPGTASYARDRRAIYILVILSYLIYTVYAAYIGIEQNYYDLLDVPVTVDEKQLRRAFRIVSARHHPDKGGDEHVFRMLRTAYDVLADPVTRFAYDRFGSQVVQWDKMTELSGYMARGLLAQLPFYIGSSIFILVLGYVQSSHAIYWRVLSFLTLAAGNFSIAVHSQRSTILVWLVPHFIQFQQMALLQSLCITMLIAISQIGPVLFPQPQTLNSADAVAESAALARICNAEATQAMQLTHLPFAKGNTRTTELYTKTAQWMVQARVDQDPEVVAARSAIMKSGQIGS